MENICCSREWFPPARAALASYSFRVTRLAYANKKHDTLDGLGPGLVLLYLFTSQKLALVMSTIPSAILDQMFYST